MTVFNCTINIQLQSTTIFSVIAFDVEGVYNLFDFSDLRGE